MKNITAEQYLDIIEDLYMVPQETRNAILDDKQEIETRLRGYDYTDVATVVKDYYLHNDKKFFPRLGGVIAMLDDRGVKYYGGFQNPKPLPKSAYNPEMSYTDFVAMLSNNWDTWKIVNPYWYTRFQNIRKIKDQKFYNRDAEWEMRHTVAQMALELAKDIFEYRDSPEVKNSIVDPVLWLNHKSVLPLEPETVFELVGSRLAVLAYEG